MSKFSIVPSRFIPNDRDAVARIGSSIRGTISGATRPDRSERDSSRSQSRLHRHFEPPPSDRTPFTSDGGWREDGQMQRYSPEFRRDAVALVRSSGRSIVAVAQELGINDTTLGNWVRDDRKQTNAAGLPPGPEDGEMEEVRRLRKRIAELEKEREILKRAVAFWVKEESRG